MKRVQPYWLVAGGFLVIFVTYFVFQGWKEIRQASIKQVRIEKEALWQAEVYQEITGLLLTEYFASGEKKTEIMAEVASIRPKKIGFFKTPLIKVAELLKPQILFYADGKKVSHIRADGGEMNTANKKILLKGEVSLLGPGGQSLSTEEMMLDVKRRLLSVKGRFTLEKNGDIIKGKGLDSDVELKDFKTRVRPGYK